MKKNLRLNQKKKKKNDLIDNIIFGDIDTNNNNDNNPNNGTKQISIQYQCCTPYFQFGNVIFFYCPNSLSNLETSEKYYTNSLDLYQMPNPPFAIGSKCK